MPSPGPAHSSRIASAISREREAIERAFDERLAELAVNIGRELAAETEERVATALAAASRENAEALNRAVRRFSACENRGQWAAALLDSTGPYCSRAVLFYVGPQFVRLLRSRGLSRDAALEVPLNQAPAIAAAIASREMVVTLAKPGELSAPIAALFAEGRCAVLPVIARQRTAAVLVAAGDPMDANGLEAMAALAGAALERTSHPNALPDAAEGAPDEALVLRAQRFARVRVAEIRLLKSRQVIEGRTAHRLYAFLKEEIDAARVDYAREFLQASPSMPDYLHLELIRTLANENTAVLGEEYPGPLA